MSTKKKKAKQYNPTKALTARIRKDARKCRLYRWESEDHSVEAFRTHGPYHPDKNDDIMAAASQTPQSWLGVVTAYFLEPNGDYYEETLTFGPLGPLTLVQEIRDVVDLIEAAATEARESGDPQHYQDTCSALYLYTPELAASLDDDEWVKQQAAKRADLVQSRLKQVPT